jgi:golgi-specific brefeldin A-resistance guanine nucleotide exchange factor 1
MRELLESFRLPGEAQQISRITEVFAAIYFAAGPGTTGLVTSLVV